MSTFKELFNHLLNTFRSSHNSNRVDIIFDLYLSISPKNNERGRRANKNPIEFILSSEEQKLASDMSSFWSMSSNKMQVQQLFITYVLNVLKDKRHFFLGGAYSCDITQCLKLVDGNYTKFDSLKCDHEEADDRMMVHITHGYKSFQISNKRSGSIIVASPDTDVLVSLIYHYNNTWGYMNHDNKLWCLTKSGGSRQIYPIHELCSALKQPFTSVRPNLINVLPALHALTGCDTTSKIGTKLPPTKLLNSFSLIENFGKLPLNADMILKAEKFLVHCLLKSSEKKICTFDELRYEFYHNNLVDTNLTKLPCTSGSIVHHIKRAYYQCYLWLNAIHVSFPKLNPQDYGYSTDIDGMISPIICNPCLITPEDFPIPCKCKKCARENVCPCRILKIMCCHYCKCNEQCTNPYATLSNP